MARNKAPKPLTEAPPEPDSSSATSDDDTTTTTTTATAAAASSSTELEDEAVSSSAASSSSSSDDEEEETPTTPPPPPPPPPPTTTPKKLPSTTTTKKQSTFSDDDKPQTPLTKPRSKSSSSTVSALVAEKRPPSETDEKATTTTSAKRPRKEKAVMAVQQQQEKEQQDGSKKLFQRIFSSGDEIEILKGMIEYKAKKKADPMVDVDDFYGFVKKSLHVDVTKGQVVDKVRRLKKKFHNAKKKKISNPHELQCFVLSKKIWDLDNADAEDGVGGVGGDEIVGNGGGEVEKVVPKSNSKPRVVKSKVGNGNVNANVSVSEDRKKGDMMEVDEGEKSVKVVEFDVKDEEDEDVEVGEDLAKEKLRNKGLKKMGAKARAELDAMWEKVAMEEMRVEILRRQTKQEESRRIMEALGD